MTLFVGAPENGIASPTSDVGGRVGGKGQSCTLFANVFVSHLSFVADLLPSSLCQPGLSLMRVATPRGHEGYTISQPNALPGWSLSTIDHLRPGSKVIDSARRTVIYAGPVSCRPGLSLKFCCCGDCLVSVPGGGRSADPAMGHCDVTVAAVPLPPCVPDEKHPDRSPASV